MIDQVLMNLVLNARDAMPNGGRLAVTLEVPEAGLAGPALRKPGRFLCLSVADTGCGIAPENLTRIFEPFFTTKEPGCGTGLGLATVARIVTQHQGWIDVQSAKGSGTTFRVYLPALDRLPLKTPGLSASITRGKGERILLLEDDEAVRAMARTVLERFGYRVIEADTAARALQRWEEQGGAFDLLISDLILPDGASGNQVAQQLTSATSKLRVIFVSGYSSEIVARHLSGTGHNILQKPFSAEGLLSTVRQCLEGAREVRD
jgi:CheY-like chemotaxis protein